MKELPIKIEAIVYSVDAKGDYTFLLLKRTPEDGDFWQPVTGTVHDGESLHECTLRELEEETDVTEVKNVSKEIWRFDWRRGDNTTIEFVFGVEIYANPEIVLNNAEHSEYMWVNYEKALKILGRDNNKKAFTKFKEHFGF